MWGSQNSPASTGAGLNFANNIHAPMHTTHGPMLGPPLSPLTRVSFPRQTTDCPTCPTGPTTARGNLIEPLHGRTTATRARPYRPLRPIDQILGPPVFWAKLREGIRKTPPERGPKIGQQYIKPPPAMSGPHWRPTAKPTGPGINQHQTGWSACLPMQYPDNLGARLLASLSKALGSEGCKGVDPCGSYTYICTILGPQRPVD